MSKLQAAMHGATASGVIVQELSRSWQYRTDEVGDLALLLIVVELVWYIGKMVIWVWDRITGRPKQVERRVWKSYQRERVIQRYRPEQDRHHPHFAGG